MLAAAVALFPEGLTAERAKATNARGTALRLAGRSEDAAAAFRSAAAGFGTAGLPLEHGAAMYNLGLVERERGDTEAAVAAFSSASELLDPEKVPAYSSAASRELASALLARGELARARTAADEAMTLADRAGDLVGLGGAANMLGLIQLAAGKPRPAAEAFRSAAGAHPRSLRPEPYAMAKANMALAYERDERLAHARLAAHQALGIATAEPVRQQAEAVLARVGREVGQLLLVLDEEPDKRWPNLVRDELLLWVVTDPTDRRAEAGAWVDGILTRMNAPDLAEAWLGALLEMPPEEATVVISGVMDALTERDSEVEQKFRSLNCRSLARFHVPQMERLAGLFNKQAATRGLPTDWA